MTLRTVEQMAAELNHSVRWVHERTRRDEIPCRVVPHGRRILFEPEWIAAWLDGAELERIDLPAGGRIVRPKSNGAAS